MSQTNQDSISHYKRAIELYKKGQYDQAIQGYTSAIQINPEYAIAYSHRGNALQELKKYDQAIQDYTSAIQINPQYAKAYFNRGNAFKALKKFDEAIEDYSNAIQINPLLADAQFNRGNAFKQVKKYDQAIEDYTIAIKINPQYAPAYSNRGIAYYNLKKYNQAIQDYASAIKIQPKNPLYHASLGFLYYHLKQFPKSKEYLTKAKDLSLNLTPIDLQSLKLSKQNLNFINDKIKLLMLIDEELQQIKDEVMNLHKTQSISFEEEQIIFKKIHSFEDMFYQTLDLKEKIDRPFDKNQFLEMFQAFKQQIFQEFRQYQQISERKFNEIGKDLLQIQQQEPYVIQQELNRLKQPNNSNQYLYYRSLFWRLYNYLHAMSLISSDLFKNNLDSVIETNSEKVLEIVQKSVKIGAGILESLPIVGSTFIIINQVLDSFVEYTKEQKFKARVIRLTSILQQFAVTVQDLEREIQFGIFNLIKIQKFNFADDNQNEYQQFIDNLSKIECNFEKQSDNVYWMLGIKHSIVILNYLETNYQQIINESSKKKLRDFMLNSIENYATITIQKRPKPKQQQSCSCQLI